jgi:hypothetical protein
MIVGRKKRQKSAIIYTAIIGSVFIISLVLVLRFINKNAQVETLVDVGDTSFTVYGLHGYTFEYADISSIELRDTVPEILERTNGFAVDEVRKGRFKLEELGDCILYLTVQKGPFVYVRMEDLYVILNFADPAKTKQLYYDLKDMTGK